MNEKFDNTIEFSEQERELIRLLDLDEKSQESTTLLDAWQAEQQLRRDAAPSGRLDVEINIRLAQIYLAANRRNKAWEVLNDAMQQALNEETDDLQLQIEGLMDEMEGV